MIQLLEDRVLVFPLEEPDVSPGGIHIPDQAQKRPVKGVVISIGPGRYTDKGFLVPMKTKKGDTVLFPSYVWEEVNINDKEYYVIKEEKILAILGRKENDGNGKEQSGKTTDS